MSNEPLLVHGTALTCMGSGVLLLGPAGAGKSDLALRLIATPLSGLGSTPFQLVADDQVLVERHDARLIARSPATIAGQLEIRGIGIIAVPYATEADLTLVVELTKSHTDIERLPEPASTKLAGLSLPIIRLFPFEASATAKLAASLASARSARPPH